MKPRFWRRRYIVDWKLQGCLFVHGMFYGGLVLLTVVIGIFAPLVWNLAELEHAPTFEEQAIVMLYLHERFWWLVILCIAVVAFGAVRFSHRLAGPLVRYKRNLRLVAEGKLPRPLRSRTGDYLQEEVDCLNAAVAGVVERVDAVRHAQVGVRREVTALLDRSVGASEELAALVAACDLLDDAVRRFRHVDPGDQQAPAKEPVVSSALAGHAGGV